MNVDEKVKKVEERLAQRNQLIKDVKFRESLPSALIERVERLEERVIKLENNLKGEKNGKRGRKKQSDTNTDVSSNI